MAEKKILHAGITWACIARLVKGQTETIELDPETSLVIAKIPEPKGSKKGLRGRGTYIFTDRNE